jgi:CheY-like chemotaxis protein
MDGYELVVRLRHLLPGLHKVIAVTGYGQAQDRARAITAGFHHHLVKPIQAQVLLEILDEIGRSSSEKPEDAPAHQPT